MLPENIMRKLENAEYYIMIDGEKVAEIKFGDIETVSDFEDDKIHITETSGKIVVSKDGIILDECDFDDCIDEYKDSLDPLAGIIKILDKQQGEKEMDRLIRDVNTIHPEQDKDKLLEKTSILNRPTLFDDWQDPNLLKEYTEKWLKETLKKNPDPIFIHKDSCFNLIGNFDEKQPKVTFEIFEEEPTIICVKEKDEMSSFIKAISGGRVSEYYADSYRFDYQDRLLELLDGEKVIATFNAENVDKVWYKDSRVIQEKEVSEDDINE